MKKKIVLFLIAIALFIGISQSMFVLDKGEYAIVKQFGEVVAIHDEPGMKFKVPVIQSVDTLPNKVLVYDLPISEVITKDKQTMVADSFAMWRISDPKKFIASVNGSITTATGRIEYLVYNAMKNEISSRTQEEVVSDRTGELARDITETARPNFEQYGIELLSVETKHLDLPYDNKESVYKRMIAERNNISATYAAEGEKEATIITNEAAKEAAVLLATANAQAEQLRAEGEAEYMKILSEAYNNSSKAEFYEFVRSLEAAEKSLAQNGNILILNQDSPLVELFYGQ